MRISGPISVQRPGPAPGWTGHGPRVVYIRAAEPPLRHARTLPPQQRGDAACLTLIAAQMLAGALPRTGGYAEAPDEDAPIFALSA